MASQNRPASPEHAPDPSNSYERSHPENESGQGRLDNNHEATPADQADRMDRVVSNPKHPSRQVNGQDDVKMDAPQQPLNHLDLARAPAKRPTPPLPPDVARPVAPQPDHSMFEEEAMDADQRPQDIHDPEEQRHPRREGKGGTPDATDERE